MPDIKPFRAMLYNRRAVEAKNVMAPPYDVIGAELRQALYRRSPYNIVRLILSDAKDPYADAQHSFDAWKHAGILAPEEIPALYFLVQTFALPGGTVVRRKGFIAACLLEEFSKGTVFPHERTLSGPKEDRFRLMEATHAMFSQIFSLYADPKHVMDAVMEPTLAREPLFDLEYDDVRNTLWACDDPLAVLTAVDLLRDQKVVVADGHHRYETALRFRDAQRLKNPGHTGKEPYNFVPMFFANIHDPGLLIFPTHRLVHGLQDFRQEDLVRDLGRSFRIEEHPSAESLKAALARAEHHAFGLLLPRAPKFALLEWNGGKVVPGRPGEPQIVSQLDVSILHTVIIDRILGISEEMQLRKVHLEYVRNASEAIAAVASGTAQAAFLMNAPRMDQVRVIAESGCTMPQKSTYFYPKLLSGLVNYSFDGRP